MFYARLALQPEDVGALGLVVSHSGNSRRNSEEELGSEDKNAQEHD